MLLTSGVFVIMMTSFTQGILLTCPEPIRKHLIRCDQYIVCEIDENGFPQDLVMDCPFGTLYDTVSGCVFPDMSDCSINHCSIHNTGRTYKGVGNCRGYWECVNGGPVARCCPPGIRFENGCSYPVDKNCNDNCFGDAVSEPKPCDKIGSVDKRGFRQMTSDGLQYFSCPSGSLYVAEDCSCNGTDPTPVQPDPCKPDVVLNFKDGMIRDSSGNNNYVSSTGVVVQADGQARFEGKGSIDIQRFNNIDGVKTIYIKVTFTMSRASDVIDMVIVSNKCNRIEHSIMLKWKRYGNTLLFRTTTKDMPLYKDTSVFVKAGKIGEETTVVYRVENDHLIGMVQNRESTTPAPGPLKAIKCGLQIGSADGEIGFYGTIRDVTVYLCNPYAK